MILMTSKLSLFILFGAVVATNAFLLSTADQSLQTYYRNKLQITSPHSTITTATRPTHHALKSAVVASNAIDTPRNFISFPNSVLTVSVSFMIGAMTAMILLIAKHGLMAINKRLLSKYPLPTLVASGALLGGIVHFFDDNGHNNHHHSYTAPTFTSLAADDKLVSKENSNLAAKRLYLRLLALIVTIGSGFSMGIAGPAAEMGMVVAYHFSAWLNINDDIAMVLRIIVAGAAAGVGANFKAPLTGLLFAVEVTRRMIIVSSQPAVNISPAQQQPQEILALTGAIVGALLLVNRGQLMLTSSSSAPPLLPSALSSLSSSSLSVTHALALIVLGCLTAVHVSYDQLRRWLLDKDQPWQKRVNKRLRPVIVGLACGLAALYGYPQHLSSGFNQLTGLMMMMQPSHPHIGLRLALSFTAVRFLLVALCSATIGLVGGQFAPMVFLGGGVGAVFYHLLVAMSAIAVGPVSSGLFVLCGAAAMLGLQFKAILMASIFIAEATGQMALLIPALITAAVAMVSKAIITQEEDKKA